VWPGLAVGEVVDGVDQMPQVPAKPVQLPDDQGASRPERLQTRLESRPLVARSGGKIGVQAFDFQTGRQQRIALQIENLGALEAGWPADLVHAAGIYLADDDLGLGFAYSG
jgi:hypothetical protein